MLAAAAVIAVAHSRGDTPAPAAPDATTTATYDAAWQERRHLTDLELTCEDQVRAQLKAPATAAFTGVRTTRQADARFVVTVGAVDAQNGFGAQLRTAFTCTHLAGRTTVAFQ
ncbi:hypothetical protein GQ85_42610 [Rhodococcus rhodochrous]|nr:hypothetical protein GQ85_42610 [Rhodococcus rhodochrous]